MMNHPNYNKNFISLLYYKKNKNKNDKKYMKNKKDIIYYINMEETHINTKKAIEHLKNRQILYYNVKNHYRMFKREYNFVKKFLIILYINHTSTNEKNRGLTHNYFVKKHKLNASTTTSCIRKLSPVFIDVCQGDVGMKAKKVITLNENGLEVAKFFYEQENDKKLPGCNQ